MYAIVKTGGKQYRVERGQRLLVERLTASQGDDVKLEPVLYRSDDVVFDKAGLAEVAVTAKVLAHVRGEKLRVFKFKPKRGYRRRTGHRQQLTRIEVTEIAAGKQKAPAREVDAAAATAETSEARATPVAAKRPAAKKPAAAKAKAPAKTGEGAAGKAPAKARTKPREDDDGS